VKNSEIVGLSDKELLERLDNEKDYLSRLRLNHAISPLDNPHKIGEVRRNVARLLTETQRRKNASPDGSEKSEL
jgi:large subunit ribosomal protein L29